jgi:16S rRNA (cytosine1402-N4)-methyltransferase
MPVMKEEMVSYLLTDLSGIYVDCTLGAGGHAAAILQALGPQGRLIGIDRDARAIANFRRQSARLSSRVTLLHSRYALVGDLLTAEGILQVDGVMFDLGLASFQIDEAERGFSYLHDGPLDMRMDSSQPITARVVINEYSEGDLAGIIRDYGEEPHPRRIVRAIVRARAMAAIETTGQLAEIIRGSVPKAQVIKSLSRVFQAIRIEVNGELEELGRGLEVAVTLLKPGGRLVVICYQSLEDRAVKRLFARLSGVCQCPRDLPQCICNPRKELQVLTRRAVRPTLEEVERNPRARSARLRAAEKMNP